MNRRYRTLIVVGSAAALALLASVGVYQAIVKASAPVPVGRHNVVVAVAPLSLGTLLTADDVKVLPWPDDAKIAGSFASPDAVIGRGLIAPLVANEPVVDDKLAPVGSGGGLPPAIPTGMRAMAVKVNEVIGVAGFAVPGTRVDVVATVRPDKEDISRVVLSNVMVLAAGTNQEQTKTNEPIKTTVVTLLVSPDDAEKLALAMNEGRISLALRNPLDAAATDTKGVRMSNLMGIATPAPTPAAPPRVAKKAPAPVVTPPPPPPPPPPAPYTVEVIRAAKRTTEIIK